MSAALRCFAAQGFRATSMSDIIKESGLSAGAIYLYFPSKSDIAAGVARRTMEARSAEIAALAYSDPVPPPAELIARIGEAFSDSEVTPGIIVQLWGEAMTSPEFAEIATEAFGGLKGTLTEYLERWAEQENYPTPAGARAWAADITPIFASLIQGYFLQSTLLPGFDADRYFGGVASLFSQPG